jgi:hypothetical protein
MEPRVECECHACPTMSTESTEAQACGAHALLWNAFCMTRAVRTLHEGDDNAPHFNCRISAWSSLCDIDRKRAPVFRRLLDTLSETILCDENFRASESPACRWSCRFSPRLGNTRPTLGSSYTNGNIG